AQLCAFTSAVLRAEASQEPGHYDVIHSHYWLSGQVGWLARDRWGIPLIHSAHTLAKVKNALLAEGDVPEPRSRVIGEEQVVAEADRLIASTADEAAQLVQWYDADPAKVLTVPPGVDLDRFRPAEGARARLGVPDDALVLLFVGRIQPLKAPDLLLRAAAHLIAYDPALRSRMIVYVVGAPSGSGLDEPTSLLALANTLGIADRVRFLAPMPPDDLADYYRAADVTVVPSHNESFGLVALEAQACGTPVVAARVGGLVTAVADGFSGLLVDGHRAPDYADAITKVLGDRAAFSRAAVEHASRFSWDRTTGLLLDAYADAMTGPAFGSDPARPAA
nr:D-inositol-3-phosphate glycosyltransferase [Geodermatophilaceae bacterium]